MRGGLWERAGTPKRGICVLLNGHSEFLEKYGEVTEELTARGFVVASLDWRGQGASERRGANRAAHVANFEAYDSDLGALLLQTVMPLQRAAGDKPLPVIALGHSMGAHILLRHLHDHPRRFAAAVLVSPMLEIDLGKYSARTARAVLFALNLWRPSTKLVFGAENHDPLDIAFENNVVTSDRTRFERTKRLIAAQPFLRINGPTFGWMRAAFRSMQMMTRRGYAEDIATPLLVFGAGHDRIVSTEAIRQFVKRLPDARYVEIEDSEHEILMERDSIRARFWAEFDAFIDPYLASSE